MADVEVYIGNLKDPHFKWEGGDWDGNSPKRMSPFFPKPSAFFDKVISQIINKKLYGKQVDWSCWVAPLYPAEILQMVIQHYEEELKMPDQIKGIKRYIRKLDRNQKYALVACEIS